MEPPSPPTVNNRQQILNSKPSHPFPLNVDVICEWPLRKVVDQIEDQKKKRTSYFDAFLVENEK